MSPIPPALVRTLLVLALLGAIEVGSRAGLIPTIALAAPTAVLEALRRAVTSGELWPHLARTSLETFAAFGIAVAVGMPLGVLLWRVSYLARVLEPYLAALYAMPLVFFYPLLLVVLGLGAAPIVAVAAAMSAVPVVLQTRVGLAEVPDIYRRVARSLRCTPARTFTAILLPAAAPYLFVGLKMGFIYAFIGAMGMEFVLSDIGLGQMVRYTYNSFETPKMYAYIAVGIGIASVNTAVLGWAEAALRGRSAR